MWKNIIAMVLSRGIYVWLFCSKFLSPFIQKNNSVGNSIKPNGIIIIIFKLLIILVGKLFYYARLLQAVLMCLYFLNNFLLAISQRKLLCLKNFFLIAILQNVTLLKDAVVTTTTFDYTAFLEIFLLLFSALMSTHLQYFE